MTDGAEPLKLTKTKHINTLELRYKESKRTPD